MRDKTWSSSAWQSLVQVDENEPATGYQTPTSPPKSELALQKGFRRRTWTGPAWLDNVTSTGHVNPHCTLSANFAIRTALSLHLCCDAHVMFDASCQELPFADLFCHQGMFDWTSILHDSKLC